MNEPLRVSKKSEFEIELGELLDKHDVNFYVGLIDFTNYFCDKGEYAETLVGQIERAKMRLLIAAEKVSEQRHHAVAEELSKQADNKATVALMKRPSADEQKGPQGINSPK